MLIADVNVFVYAHRPESDRHDDYRSWLSEALTGDEPFGVAEPVLAEFMRIVTSPSVYTDPTPGPVALDFCRVVLTSSPASVPVRPGVRHWTLFDGLCRSVGASAAAVPDAYLAALAIEHGATWVTTRKTFAGFPGLRWRRPFD